MKYSFSFLLLVLISSGSFAQSGQQKEVVMAVEILRSAMINADEVVLNAAVSENLSYGHSNGRVENKKEFVDNIVTGKSSFVTIDISDQTISVIHKTAVVRHILSATATDAGKAGLVKLRVLLIFEKEKGRWKLLARQAIRID